MLATKNSVRRFFSWPCRIESGPASGLRFYAGDVKAGFQDGWYERPVQDALAGILRKGQVCVDVGANVGFFSILMAKLVGASGRVHAIEPVPWNARAVRWNARLNRFKHIAVHGAALSDHSGTAELLLARHIGGAMLSEVGRPPDESGRIVVRVDTLDALVTRHHIDPPDFVKIDVEGAEIKVLRGMRSVLHDCRPRLLLEFDDATAEGCARKLSECSALLTGLGYSLAELEPAYLGTQWYVRHVLANP